MGKRNLMRKIQNTSRESIYQVANISPRCLAFVISFPLLKY